jgi:segregation and condensation protein A
VTAESRVSETQTPEPTAPEAPAPPAPAPPADAPEAADEFALELPVFHGPLELLLHLIERQELDVTEVSLVAVAEQYLEHVRAGDHIDLGALASFIAVGARLLLLKSRALLPRDPDAEDEIDDGDHDPQALLDALVEYRRYRRAAEHLRGLEEEHRTGYRRDAPPPELPPSSGLEGVTAQHLFALFREVLERLPEEEPQPEVARPRVRLRDRISGLVRRLEQEPSVSFRDVIGAAPSRLVVIIDFLAVLELIRSRFIEARQDGAFGEIVLSRIEGATPPSSAQLEEDMPGL